MIECLKLFLNEILTEGLLINVQNPKIKYQRSNSDFFGNDAKYKLKLAQPRYASDKVSLK